MILIKRAYDPVEFSDGARFLVDRLWPRGIKKEALAITGWCREAAPSDELRHWYHHNLQQWDEFRERYFAELKSYPAAWRPLLEAAQRGDITLLYGSKDVAHNNAVALREFLNRKLENNRR